MKRRGFTLIELLVVIAIIAILAAILFPVFAKARNRANATACISNLHQLFLAARQYCEDYDGHAPGWNAKPNQAHDPSGNKGWFPWEALGYAQPPNGGANQPGLLVSYLKSNELKRCPVDTGDTFNPEQPNNVLDHHPYWQRTGTNTGTGKASNDGTSYPFNPYVGTKNPDSEPPTLRYASMGVVYDSSNRCCFWDGQFWHPFKTQTSRNMVMWNGSARLVTSENETRKYIW